MPLPERSLIESKTLLGSSQSEKMIKVPPIGPTPSCFDRRRAQPRAQLISEWVPESLQRPFTINSV